MNTQVKGLGIAAVFAALLAALVLLAGGFIFHTPAIENAFGSLAGPDIPSPYLNWGGVRQYNGGMALRQATTTVCAIQSPVSTSTLVEAGVRFDVSSSTATIVDIAKANTAFATTTAIGTAYNIGASGQGFIHASTSPSAGAVEVFAPNQWVVVGIRQAISAGDTAGTGFVPTGRCQASFIEYPLGI